MPQDLPRYVSTALHLDADINHAERGPVFLSDEELDESLERVIEGCLRVADTGHVSEVLLAVGGLPNDTSFHSFLRTSQYFRVFYPRNTRIPPVPEDR